MIYTITLNPAIDHVIETKDFVLDETNYYQNDYQTIGGKGINVAVLLNNLQAQVNALGIMGKDNSKVFLEKFKEINLHNNFIMFDGNTRTNYKIKDLDNNKETELNGLGDSFDAHKFKDGMEFLRKNLKANDLVIASGSVPTSLPDGVYFQIGELVEKKKAIFILDSSKKWSLEGIKAHPYLIKPNLQEICELLKIEFRNDYSLSDLENMILEVRKLGARNILVSMGGQGALYFSENDELYKVGIAKGKVVNSVGAGDSMVGGFAYGLVNNFSIEKTLQYAAASGGATAFSEWIGSKELIEELVPTIMIEKLK
ncbi:1-phosphofructokinase [Mesoplasma lactucae]|uniref:1-phosphofructokinase n=1 Tax=Mesoplasma lactucae ATCC 49193 TaxID=81460 RepID=A0A291IR42_9MOLU|nr:1-phosphofructokinase [Mesoplasma lactucae]ATG97208.1 1-phosphofructokinase [Mesoplasma lactucae ATCC 49193]ATZ20350.1 1-phosphofructokinase [Mesoplasma lactucae ATCC 49193]MCL8216521.1 Tagatose-6-phosphate kinase [Mesoplasma lactucae ATCC 49193]